MLSTRNPFVPLPADGNDNSVAPVISPDGRFVVFSSSANDLLPGGNPQPVLNVFLRDRTGNTTMLVSANSSGTGGGNGDSKFGQVSASGRYVVFQSDARDLVPGDTNGVSDIFVRDMVTGTTRVVSAATDGGFGNDASTDPVIAPDGTCVAFISSARNLVAGDTNGISDVFVRDLITQTTWLVSPGAVRPFNGTSPTVAAPSITPDGRYVAFFSTARALASAAPSNSVGEVYVRDRLTGTTTWASADAAAIVLAVFGPTNVASYHPRLSDDGRYVAFKASSTNSGNAAVVLLYDSIATTTTVVSTNGIAALPDEDDSLGPELTPDGRFVGYVRCEDATNLYSSVHLWDSETAADALVSGSGSTVPTNTFSHAPIISPNGRFVLFLSDATNLVGNAVSNGFHIYRRDLYFGTMQLVDADTNSIGSTDNELAGLSMSANGRFVAFSSPDGGLVYEDANHARDVMVRDMNEATIELISRRDPTAVSQTADAYSSMSQLSVRGEGRYVAFASLADDLVPNDTNNQSDVFVYDMLTGTNILVSVGTNGGSALGGYSSTPVISGKGRYVAFVSTATNLTPTVAGSASVYLRDLQAGTTTLVSVDTGGLPLGNINGVPQISDDGRYVTFVSRPYGYEYSYWRDVQAGVTTELSGGFLRGNFLPSMSRNGRYVAYSYYIYRNQPLEWGLRIRDMQLRMDVYTNAGTMNSVALSPDGSRVLYKRTSALYANDATNLYVTDVASGSNLFSVNSRAPLRNAAEWSKDGRYFAFVSSTNFVSQNDDGTNKVYLCDLPTGTITLIGVAGPSSGSFATWSDSPAMSGDGRFVAYRSAVPNTVAGDANPPPNIFLFDRLTGSTTILTAGQAGSSPVLWASRPAVSDSGNTVAFLDLGSGLVQSDLNRAQDAFAAPIVNSGTPVDSDGDGIPDWWTMQYFGHLTGHEYDLSRAEDDADQDGISNLQEFLAGTVPTDPASLFFVQFSAEALANGAASLSWPALPGRSYQVQYKVNLSDTLWLNALGNALVLGNQGSFTTSALQPSCYYRVLTAR